VEAATVLSSQGKETTDSGAGVSGRGGYQTPSHLGVPLVELLREASRAIEVENLSQPPQALVLWSC
jgi:hypothetical protein